MGATSTVTFSRAGIVLGLRASAPMAMSVGSYGILFGVLARGLDMSLLETVSMNVVVFAGAAQMAGMEYWHYPLPIAAIVVTVALINMRLLMLGASLRPWLAGQPGWKVYPTLHLLCDEAWAVMMSLYRNGARDAGIVLGCNLAIFFAWIPTVVAGFLIGGRIGDPDALALDFAFTAVFAAMLFSGYRSRFDLLPWAVSGSIAAVVWALVPGTWYVIAGGLSGIAVAMWRAELPNAQADIDYDAELP